MNRKILKYATLSILFLMSIFTIKEVHAEKYTGQAIWPSEHISNIYIKKVKPDGYTKYQQARFLRRSEDNKFVYCLQPYVDIDNNLPYYDVIRSDYASVLGISKASWERISLLAYYGYQYNEKGYDHSDHKWYAITQVLIWRTTNPESDIYFTDTLNGNKTSKFTAEIQEIETLIRNHYNTPKFERDLTLPIGSTTSVNDVNNVLNEYQITSTSNVSASINGNTLTITPNKVGVGTISLKKTASKYEVPPIVYFSDHSQNVFRVGTYDPVSANINIKILGGKVTLNKVDAETKLNKPQGDATLGGATYGIYKEDGTKITTITTNQDGTITSNYLPDIGRFYLIEESPSKGYLLDNRKYYFEITENNLNPTVKVYEEVIKNDFEFTKVYASNKTEIMTPEVNVKFGIYDSKNNLVKEVITDNNGLMRFTLPYGTYTVKQLTTTSGHEKIEDFIIEVSKVSDVNRKVISNAPITAKIKVVKIDSETKEVIKRANIKFKIFDVTNNEYVCQTITYPNKKTICEWETDSNGEFITAYPLKTGTYRLEEVDQVIDGYLWNQTSKEFTIDENANLITDNEYGVIFETSFENTRVKGQITIYKTGERVNIVDNKIEYKQLKLWGVKFGLFDTNNNLIKEAITNEGGFVIFDNLELGTYIVKELKVNNKYILDNKEYKIGLKYKDQYTEVVKEELKLENYLKKGSLEFTKTDISESKGLPNTLIEIYTSEDKLIFEGRTNEEGKIIIKDLPLGEYYILEKDAPVGYLLNEEKMYFRLKENNEIVKATMKDEIKKGTLEFTKVDFSTDEPLPNTLIEIYNESDELIFSGRTNENGIIIVEEIPYGKYYIIEKEAPKGYELNNEKMYFEILEDGEVIKSTMKDKQIVEEPVIENPKTFDGGIFVYIGLAVISVIGITGSFIVYRKKQNKEEN